MDPVPSTSNPPKPVRNPAKRKPKAPHPSNLASAPRRKVPPSLPPRPPAHPSQPHKTSQGLKTQRNDTTHPGFGREVVFVTRSTGLGLLIGRCRSLVVVEGYTTLRLHAMSAAIPQALLLLHALMDILPYPKGEKGMWYEIRTGSVECVDEVSAGPRGDSGVEKEKEDEVMGVNWDGIGGMEDIGGMEEDEPELTVRIKSSIQIDLHTSPRPRPGQLKLKAEGEKRRNRPSKKRRGVLSRRKVGHQVEDEETMMNASGEAGAGREGMQVVPGGVVDDEEEEEEIEER